MTVYEAITQADILRPGNNCTEEQKLDWLSILDKTINDIYGFYDGLTQKTDFDLTYTVENSAVTDLLAPDIYTELYVHYLCARIDLMNSDISRYNNESALYKGLLNDYYAFLNRTHATKEKIAVDLVGW